MPQSPSDSIEARAASSLAEALCKLRYVEAKAEGEGSAEACAEEVEARKAEETGSRSLRAARSKAMASRRQEEAPSIERKLSERDGERL